MKKKRVAGRGETNMQTMQASVVGLLTCMQRFCVRLAARLFWQAAPGQGGAGPGDTDRPHPPHVSMTASATNNATLIMLSKNFLRPPIAYRHLQPGHTNHKLQLRT